MNSKEERRRQWNEYMETQFLACLLALGPEPRPDAPDQGGWNNPWAYYRLRQEYYNECVAFLYPLMNYTPCKTEGRERHRVKQRQQRLRAMYRRWYMEQEYEYGKRDD